MARAIVYGRYHLGFADGAIKRICGALEPEWRRGCAASVRKGQQHCAKHADHAGYSSTPELIAEDREELAINLENLLEDL